MDHLCQSQRSLTEDYHELLDCRTRKLRWANHKLTKRQGEVAELKAEVAKEKEERDALLEVLRQKLRGYSEEEQVVVKAVVYSNMVLDFASGATDLGAKEATQWALEVVQRLTG